MRFCVIDTSLRVTRLDRLIPNIQKGIGRDYIYILIHTNRIEH